METEELKSVQGEQHMSENQPHRVRLPGFVSDKDIGLGDVIKHVTSAFGIEPCAGCEKRRVLLNRWLVFSPWRRG